MTVQPLEEEAIFHAARVMASPVNQASYLAEACGDNQALRARVEGLLKVYAEEKSFAGMPSAVLATIDHHPITEQPGTVIGQYKLMEQIGEGGFGLVFVAEQHQPVRRKVALKVIKPGMDTRDVIARFEAERQALALMDHPNIARVFDAGATDSGHPYFVMELVRGIPITEYCDQQQLTPRERLELFVSLCHAIQHAHQKGIIHRDVKPTNVLVTEHDGRPVVKVIDFGVAKALSQQLTERTIYTQFAQMIGTPLYMSPEQAAMSGLDIDTRSDIYSLGVMLYELLTGLTPFDRKRLQNAAIDEIRRIIREEEPPRPSLRLGQSGDQLSTLAAKRKTEPASLSRVVRGDLDWIVMKCLEKDRNRRYATANALALDIARHLADEPVSACPPSALYRLKKFVRRNKIAAAFVLLLVAAVAALSVSNVRTRRSERRATIENARAQAVSGLLQKMIRSANPDEAKDVEYTVRQLLDDFSTNFGAELTDQPEVEAEIRATMGRAYWRLGINTNAESHLTKALELRRRQFGPDHELVAESQVDYAWSLSEQQRWPEAEVAARDALRFYHERGITGLPVIQAQVVLQRVLVNSGQHDKAQSVSDEAISLARNSGAEYSELAVILHTSADSLDAQGHYPEAERAACEAVELHRRLHGARHPETAWGLQMLGRTLLDQGRLSEAETALREALAIFRERYRGDHYSLVATFGYLKQVLEARGDRAGLEAIVRQQLDESVKSTNSGMFNTLMKRARLHIDLGENGEAITCFRRALEINPNDVKVRDLSEAVETYGRAIELGATSSRPHANLAYALQSRGGWTDAEFLFREALQHLRARLAADDPQIGDVLADLTRTLLSNERFGDAEVAAREGLEIYEQKLPDDWRTFYNRSLLGASLLGQKKYADAEPLLQSGYEGMKLRDDKIPPERKPRLKEAAERMVHLHEATQQPGKAALWKERLAELDLPQQEK